MKITDIIVNNIITMLSISLLLSLLSLAISFFVDFLVINTFHVIFHYIVTSFLFSPSLSLFFIISQFSYLLACLPLLILICHCWCHYFAWLSLVSHLLLISHFRQPLTCLCVREIGHTIEYHYFISSSFSWCTEYQIIAITRSFIFIIYFHYLNRASGFITFLH